ncbi:hypothetical protein CONLIGDRAFT_354266 [Coniochaeta ligniaria NRRL 30616]|uniref:Uncharacterized protein n=1 Tax=Coniochaeta ligniaria NRRL 30616 TaxID=1408157 RepID=A0A1J7J9P0_9PEZI|nr:hypothetical protein CONLIGDRAFT_354266 [Coniochaeta ligniaria NRRL 30616]
MARESLLSGRESDRNPQHGSKHTARAAEVSAGLSAGSLATIVVFGTIFFVGGVAFVGLYLARRRRASTRITNEPEVASFDHSYTDVEESITARRKKLQKKKKEWPLTFEATEVVMSPIHHTALPQIPPLFTKQSSFGSFFGKLSPTKSTKTTKSWKQTTWIDEDNLHGPKMSDVRDVNGQPFSRESWPLYTFTAPTMPTVTTEHVHPYYRGLYQQQQMTQAQMIAAQPYVTSAGPRQLPLPPRPALVTSNWVASTMGPAGGYYNLQDLVQNGRTLTTNVPQKQAPEKTVQNRSRSRSRSRSHSRHRPSRQSSTDSTLSEILKSTEQRLAERSPSKTRPGATSSKSGNTSSRETLLARSDKPLDNTTPYQLCRSCSASPTKSNPDQPPLPASSSAPGHNRGGSDSSAFGHKRGGSDSSAVSEPDSLIEHEFQMMPAGLTSPSRTPKSQGTPEHSPANSVSSGLPTLYSESEAEEDEGSPLKPTIYQRATTVRQPMPSDNNDPFTSPAASPTRPTTSRGLPESVAQRKTTFGSGLRSAKDAASPTALQSHYASQLQEAAASSPPQQSQPAYLNLLPLDLYQLCTPPRQTAVKTPTIVSTDPNTRIDSIHPKKRMTGFFGTASSPASSPPPVPSFPLTAATTTTQQQPPTKPKAYPPPHTLRPKGSSPTLGSSGPRPPPPPASPSTPGSSSPSPKGPRPRPADSATPSPTALHSARRQQQTLLSTPVRGPAIRLRAPSNTSQTSSVYSQDANWQQQPSPPVVSTVAALRRMNSAVSNVSGTSNASDYSAAPQSPALPSLERYGSSGRGVAAATRRGRHRRGTAGSRNYLGLLEVGKRGSKLDVVVWDEKGRDDKENKKEGGGEGTPRKKEWRESKDSLGLYDEDGFLISSPVRGGD